jgi:hypothetical protein
LPLVGIIQVRNAPCDAPRDSHAEVISRFVVRDVRGRFLMFGM